MTPIKPQNRILFLYMVPETGHQQAAEAMMRAASQMDPRVSCVGLDAVSHAYPILGGVFNRMYIQMLKKAPGVWEYLYDNPDVEEMTRDARGLLTLVSSLRTRKLLREFRPQAVICTQAVPAIALAAEKRRGGMKVPLIGVVTDFGVHAYWLHKEIDLYLVGHEDIKNDMVQRGIRPERIRVTGIPIMPSFGINMTAAEARTRLKLDATKTTLLLMGGSRGMGPLEEQVEALLSLPYEFQMIVVCGRNRKAHKRIQTLAAGRPGIAVFGFLKDLAAAMSASDILISKPGGLTCSEALAKELPMVVTSPIPGQEERNVRFLTRHEVARTAATIEDLTHVVTDLLRHPKKIARMKQRAHLMSNPFSAWEAARTIFDLIHGRTPRTVRRGPDAR